MQHTSLFLGFHIAKDYDLLLKKVRPELLSLYIKEGEGMWLQEISHQGHRYLGKTVGDLVDVDQLNLQESNIISFLKKIVPTYPYETHPLMLIPMISQEELHNATLVS